MGGCSAPNCSNRTSPTMRLYSFPADPERRKKWLINSRRDKWIPTKYSWLCQVHFEDSQFERNRADGRVKLKPNAIPTLFNVSNPPKTVASKRRKASTTTKSSSKQVKKLKIECEDIAVDTINKNDDTINTISAFQTIPAYKVEEKSILLEDSQFERNRADGGVKQEPKPIPPTYVIIQTPPNTKNIKDQISNRSLLKKDSLPSPRSSSKVQFEDFQSERSRAGGWVKLEPDDFPALFFVPDSSYTKNLNNQTSNRSLLKNNALTSPRSSSKLVKTTINECDNIAAGTSNKSNYTNKISATQTISAKGNNTVEEKTTSKRNGKLIFTLGTSQMTLHCDIIFKENQNTVLNTQFTEKTATCKQIVQKLVDFNEVQDNDVNDDELISNALGQESLLEREMRYTCNIQQLKNENQRLKRNIQSIERFFNKEQLEFLTKLDIGNMQHRWSTECIMTCLKMKSVLGWNGYKYLLSLGYPGPTKSTLLKRLREMKNKSTETNQNAIESNIENLEDNIV